MAVKQIPIGRRGASFGTRKTRGRVSGGSGYTPKPVTRKPKG